MYASTLKQCSFTAISLNMSVLETNASSKFLFSWHSTKLSLRILRLTLWVCRASCVHLTPGALAHFFRNSVMTTMKQCVDERLATMSQTSRASHRKLLYCVNTRRVFRSFTILKSIPFDHCSELLYLLETQVFIFGIMHIWHKHSVMKQCK